jgi:hypothetical protein
MRGWPPLATELGLDAYLDSVRGCAATARRRRRYHQRRSLQADLTEPNDGPFARLLLRNRPPWLSSLRAAVIPTE